MANRTVRHLAERASKMPRRGGGRDAGDGEKGRVVLSDPLSISSSASNPVVIDTLTSFCHTRFLSPVPLDDIHVILHYQTTEYLLLIGDTIGWRILDGAGLREEYV
ncbi:hypothetical protein KM043_002642 [Ampulex compressa]|nr:hypothetical protein KM043_002642 [Ampulex compressa]